MVPPSLTETVTLPVIAPLVAVIVAVPAEAPPTTSPLAETDATAESDDVQLTSRVMSRVEPSL